MSNDKFTLSGPVLVSENDDSKPYIELTTRLCYLDYLNLNGVGLSSKATESFNTLIDMPIVAKINKEGTRFGSHEIRKTANGEIIFNTNAYGTHTKVWVEEDEVEIPNVGIKKVPCLFAKSKVWKRFHNVVNLILKKMEDPENYGGGLFSSWEIIGHEYHEVQGGKIYDKFTFLSNCLIDVPPAYGNVSKTLAVASKNFETELIEALEQDILALSESNVDKDKDKIIISLYKGGQQMDKKNQQAALSLVALEQKIWEAINPKGWSSQPFYSIVNIYPEEHKVICRDWDKDLEYLVVFTYEIDENDNVTIVGEGEEKKLSALLSELHNVNIQINLDDTAKLLSEKEIKIKELEDENLILRDSLSKTEKELAEAGNAIAALTKEKESLQAQISELIPYKEKVQEMEKAELERQLNEKKEELKKFALEDGLIEESELETNNDLATIFAELTLDNYEVCHEKIELFKGRRALQRYKESKNDLNVSTVNNDHNAKSNLDDDPVLLSSIDIIKSFIKK